MSNWDQEMQNWLVYGGKFPGLTDDLPQVPYPITSVPVHYEPSSQAVIVRHGDKAYLHHFWNGQEYVDEDGCVISKEEAQAEVDYSNGK